MKFTSEEIEKLFTDVETISKEKFIKILRCLSKVYYNNPDTMNEIFPDVYFDSLTQKFEKRFNQKYYEVIGIGATVDKKISVKLPVYMGSMDKITYSEYGEFKKFVTKNPADYYIAEDKLDGVSGLYYHNSKNEYKLYTRGDGNYGTDISNLIPILNLPEIPKGAMVRGEIIMKNKIFERFYSQKYKNSRALVSGIVNSKKVNIEVARNLDFVSYELSTKEKTPTVEEQLKELKRMGFDIPQYKKVVFGEKNMDLLEYTLVTFRNKSLYEIDGIIIITTNPYKIPTKGNPTYAFAYKNLRDTVQAKVKKVEWNVSKYGTLKPLVLIDPVNVGGVTIKSATGFNAKFIKTNGIGKGAILLITRSKDVIPYILDVIKPATADMPNKKYYWNNTEVDIILDEEDTDQEIILNVLYHFFSSLKIKGIAKQTLKKIIEFGFTEVSDIINLTPEDFIEMGFGEKISENMYTSIQDFFVEPVEVYNLMAATPYFGQGLGPKKIKLITDKYPNIIDNCFDCNEKIASIHGWTEKSANQFVAGLKDFRKFLKKNPNIKLVIGTTRSVEGDYKFNDQKIVFSGFRNKEWEKIIEKEGGKVVTSISSKTTLLVVKDKAQNTSKIVEAKQLNIKIMNKEEFAKLIE